MYIESKIEKVADDPTIISSPTIKYFISSRGKGKSLSVLKEAIATHSTILAPTRLPFSYYGLRHVSDDTGLVSYITLGDILTKNELDLSIDEKDGYVHVCIDEGRFILQELLSEALDAPVKIDFMSLDCDEEEDYNE